MAIDKKYNLTLLPFWKSKKDGFLMSIIVKPEHLDAFGKIEAGGRLTFKVLEDESVKNVDSPNAYLEYITKADVDAFRAKAAATAADMDI